MLLNEDRLRIESIPRITLLDASFSPEEMEDLYRKHDVFVFPTFRDTFGLVLIEALSFGMPIIATDQYAITEMAIPKYNAFIFPNHPLLDYNPATKQMYGKLYDAKVFYSALFEAEKNGKMDGVEYFLYKSILQFSQNQQLFEQYSQHSLDLYKQKFHQDIISEKIERVFTESVSKL